MPQLPLGDIGPCEVTWDYGGATPVIITPHLGKVTVRMADAVTDVFIDGQGIAPIEAFFEGSTVELEVPMARSTLSQLANTIGYRDLGTLVGNVLTLHNVAGIEMMAHAKAIVIKPMMNIGGCSVAPDPDATHWTLFFKCHPWRDFELGYDRGGQRVHMVKFKIFPNQDTGYEGEYFQEGVLGEEFEVTSANKYIDYRELANGGTNRTATMTEGTYYWGADLAAEIQIQMNAVAVAYDWLVSYSSVTHKFTITNDFGWIFDLRWKTGPHGSDNADDHIGTLIGFDDAANDTGAGTYTSDNTVP